MKKIYLTLFTILYICTTLNSQHLILSFSAQDEFSNNLSLNKIVIDNLTTNESITLNEDFTVNLSTTTLSNIVHENENLNNLYLYPNPTSFNTNLVFNNNSSEEISFLIYDHLGREILTLNKVFNLGYNTLQFKPNYEGVFFVKFIQGRRVQQQKILSTGSVSEKATLKEIKNKYSLNTNKTVSKLNLFYSPGDALKYTAHYKESIHTIFDSPIESKNVNFNINSVFYFDTNGITIKSYNGVSVGTESFFNGYMHKLVDKIMLLELLQTNYSTKPVTTNISNMDNLFHGLKDFNEDISSWDVSSVTSMSSMFSFASSFNQNLSNWNLESVINMSNMFSYASSFNQNIEYWNVSNVENMSNMFQGASSFNQDIGSWDVSNVTDMNSMFFYAYNFNQDISQWNVSNVNNMSKMFSYNNSFNQNIGSWNINNVGDLSYMFEGAIEFNHDLSSWNTTNVVNMSGLFKKATLFNQNIESWNVSNVKKMDEMFYETTSFKQDISKWYVCSVSTFENFSKQSSNDWLEIQKPFLGNTDKCEGEYPIDFLFYLDNNGVTVKARNTAIIGSKGKVNEIIYELVSEETLRDIIDDNGDLRYVVTTGISNMKQLLEYESFINDYRDISSWDVSSVTNMSRMFYKTNYLFPDISFWDVSNVIDMSDMFRDSDQVNPDLSSWDVSNVTNMSGMFRNAYLFDRDISAWDVSNVVNMESMFREVHSFNQNINTWDVSNVKNMGYMFRDTRYYHKDLNNWDVQNVENMRQMFYSSSYKQDISSWNVCDVIDYSNFTLNNLWINEKRPHFGDPNKCSGN